MQSRRFSKFTMLHHSAYGYGCVAILKGKETIEAVQALFEGCDLDRELHLLEGSRVLVNGTAYVLRNFIMGDHMMMYKVAGGHGPSSTADWRRPCPFCDLNPARVHSWRAENVAAVVEQPRAEALVRLLRWQVVPDAMHGISNMVHGVLLKALTEGLQRGGVSMATRTLFLK